MVVIKMTMKKDIGKPERSNFLSGGGYPRCFGNFSTGEGICGASRFGCNVSVNCKKYVDAIKAWEEEVGLNEVLWFYVPNTTGVPEFTPIERIIYDDEHNITHLDLPNHNFIPYNSADGIAIAVTKKEIDFLNLRVRSLELAIESLDSFLEEHRIKA